MIGSDRPVLALAIVLFAGMIAGALAKRIRLPSVTGQIAAGVVLGPAVLGLFEAHLTQSFRGLTEFALALISLSVGSHLNLRRLRNAGKRLGLLVVFDTVITSGLVAVVVLLFGQPWPLALLLGAIAVETSPGTVLAVVKETRSRGVFVKTLIAAVALSDVACIILFELARSAGRMALGAPETDPTQLLLAPLKQLSVAFIIGAVAALGMTIALRTLRRPAETATAAMLAILFAWGLAHVLDVSSILACMALGAVLSNTGQSQEEATLSPFASFEPAILAVFFTLAGLHLQLEHVLAAGALAIAVFLARASGKITASAAAMALAGATSRLRRYLGPAMLPHASIAVGLMLLLQADPVFDAMQDVVLAVGLSVVTLSEVLGPLATRFALARSGDMGKDRARLLDFLQEQNIVVDFEAETKEQAIGKLVDVLIASNQLNVDRDALLRSALAREEEVSTCVGGGLMIPHGELPNGNTLLGVMGVSKNGLPFPTPDGVPVRCVVLLATPLDQRDRHLEVLAGLTRAIGLDRHVQAHLFNAKSAAHACEILHAEDTSSFNYFLDGPRDTDRPTALADRK